MMNTLITILSFFSFQISISAQFSNEPFVIVLGVAQDGGYPHIGCEKHCCEMAWKYDSVGRNITSLALVDPVSLNWWLFEATPDMSKQLRLFSELTQHSFNYLPSGIFLTHAHIGHYTGLMELGREAMNSKNVLVYCLPKMRSFLENNGPWSQLVSLQNIELHSLQPDSVLHLNARISITAFAVPHRDEFSETAGFSMNAQGKEYLFIPDINKWALFDKNIIELVKRSDVAFLDATFYSPAELSNINIEEVPHPFVVETMELFKNEDEAIRKKIYFIHLNHTNPLLRNGLEVDLLIASGFHIAKQGFVY